MKSKYQKVGQSDEVVNEEPLESVTNESDEGSREHNRP